MEDTPRLEVPADAAAPHPWLPPHLTLAGLLLLVYVASQAFLVSASEEWPALWAPDSGVWFDVLQTAGVVLVVATLALVPFCRKRASWWLHTLCWTPIGIGLIFRAVDWVVYLQSGLHINLMVTSHAHREAFQLVLHAIPTAQLVLPLLALTIAVLLARWSYARVGTVLISPLRLFAISATLLVIITLSAARVVRPTIEYATTGPERTTYRSWLLARRERSCLRDPACAESMNKLDETIRRKLTRFGMRVNPNAKLPLLKPVVYRRALPFAPEGPRVARPNVIVVFLESMSAFFVNAYNPRTPSMTPQLDAFAAEAMRVDNYYNSTTPTVTSLVATLCSLHPPSGHEEFGASFYGALHCVGDTLAPHGYDSTFIRGIGKEFANTGPFLESQQFKVLDYQDVRSGLGEEPQSWGYSDHQLFRFLTRTLDSRGSDAPFFLGMTTVDLHPPFDLTPVPEVLPGEDGRLFNIVHSTDDAFGEFWRWFKTSRYVDNTIVIVTADHAVLPKPEYMQLRGPDWEKSFFDRIPLFIHAPGLAMPRTWQPEVASSVDLLPTILHMLAINEPNPFEGVSLFDDRQAKQGVLGDHTYLMFSNQLDARGQRVLDNFTVGDCAPELEVARTDMLTRCEQKRWHEWKLRLIDQRRIWAGGPAVASLRSP